MINYFENDGDYDYDGSVSDALSDYSIEEDDFLNSMGALSPRERCAPVAARELL
jgi:hypothetical protein